MRTHPRPSIRRWLATLVAVLAALIIGSSAATALPPGGASGNSPGTSSTVSGSVRAGDYLSFTLNGFPAGSTVSIKFDDGNTCSSNAPQGACVVHQQVVPSNGLLKGSFQVPKDIKQGKHTLRFLTAVRVGDDGSSKGYSNKSPQFTVTGVNSAAQGGGSVSGTQVDPNAGSNSGGSGSGSNGNSGSNGGQGSGSGSGGNSGSNGGSGSDAGTSGQGGTTTQYVDENGNPLTEEQAKALQEEGKGGQVKEVTEEVEESQSASASATPTASASASASASADSRGAREASATTEDSGSQFPWIGAGALAAVAIVAAVVLVRRRRAAQAESSDSAGSAD
ncbi:plasmid partitioning protein [Rothia kristinae]|uniref:plasmid partitioning protein n=1 Tax=Rothia kristinae TaxID=37923 RepID=UPI0033C57C56